MSAQQLKHVYKLCNSLAFLYNDLLCPVNKSGLDLEGSDRHTVNGYLLMSELSHMQEVYCSLVNTE